MNTEEHSIVVDFSKLGGPVYSGRKRGELVRKKMKIDSVDQGEAIVHVKIPADAYSVTSSFFLGLFGESIRRAGDRQTFLKKFQFDCPPVFQETFDSCIARALQEQTELVRENRK